MFNYNNCVGMDESDVAITNGNNTHDVTDAIKFDILKDSTYEVGGTESSRGIFQKLLFKTFLEFYSSTR